MRWLVMVLLMMMCIMMLIMYALLVAASDADDRAERMCREWEEDNDELVE